MKIRPFPQSMSPGLLLILTGLAQAQPDTNETAAEADITLLANRLNTEFGSTFSAAGDINRDGVTDIAVADRSAMVDGQISSGSVYIVSGADGALLRTYVGVAARSQYFGLSLASLDADGDGVGDLAVGSPGRAGTDGVQGAGGVTVYSGSDGSVLIDVMGANRSQFGSSMVNAGDQNDDGIEDLFVGAPLGDGAKGQVITISGADGTVIRTLGTDAPPYNGFSTAIAASGDIDGDGRMELAVASPGYSGDVIYGVGRVQLVRSSDSSVVDEVFGEGFYNRLGTTLAPAADVDGDGVNELMVGSFWNGTLLLLSGADLGLVRDLSLTLPANRAVNAGGSIDFDGDGVQDWLVGSPGMGYDDAGRIVGGVRIISGVDESTLMERLADSPVTGLGQTQTVLPGVGIAVGESRLYNRETGGYGAAYLWLVDTVLDSDGDGIPDDQDENPNSNMNPTINILGRDTGVGNFVGGNGVTLADLFDGLGSTDDYNNPTHYFTSVVHLTNRLVDQGLITDVDRKVINAAARDGAVKGKSKGGK